MFELVNIDNGGDSGGDGSGGGKSVFVEVFVSIVVKGAMVVVIVPDLFIALCFPRECCP